MTAGKDARRESSDLAQSAGAYVVKEGGQWVVYVTVVYPDAVSEHRIAGYYSEARARTAARWMGLCANRKMDDTSLRIKLSD